MKQILLSVFFAFMVAGCVKTLPITPIDAPVVSASDGATYDAGRDASDADMKLEMSARQQSNKIDVDIKVTDAATASGEIQKLVTDMGGYVKSGTASHVIAYVPADRADRFLDRMGTDIGKLRKIDRRTTDVTDDARDVSAKLESMIAVRTRYTELLAKTTDVSEIMKIESELQRVNADILVLQGRLGNIQNRVKYTLFNIDIDDTTIWSGVKTMFKTPAFYVLLLPFVALALV